MVDDDIDKLAWQYDLSATAYDKLYEDIQSRKYLTVYEILGGDEILDIGVGTGYLYRVIDKYAVGVDISFESLRIAAGKSRYLDCILADGRDPPLKPKFDTLLCISTIHHFGELDRSIGKLIRYGKRAGISIMKKILDYRNISEISEEYGLKIIDLWDDYGLIKM